ncbi:hypothetical protein AVEN_85919-1, partial [Araneus ventricosus]
TFFEIPRFFRTTSYTGHNIIVTSQHVESSLIHCSTASSSTFSEQSNWSLAGLKVGWTSPMQ